MERRTYIITGQKASAEEIFCLIKTGESEQIFQKAILEQGRGHVSSHFSCWDSCACTLIYFRREEATDQQSEPSLLHITQCVVLPWTDVTEERRCAPSSSLENTHHRSFL